MTRFPKVGTVASRDGIVGPVNGRAPFVGIRTDNYDAVHVYNNYAVADVGFQADNVNEYNAIGNVHVVPSAIPTDFWTPDVTWMRKWQLLQFLPDRYGWEASSLDLLFRPPQ